MTPEVNAVLIPPRPRLRQVALASAFVVLAVFAWGLTHLVSRSGILLLAASLAGAYLGLRQFAQEYAILHHCGIAIGEVVEYQGSYSDALPVQRSYYRGGSSKIRYRFATSDGMFYHGESDANKLPTGAGMPIEIVYDRRNPKNNVPRDKIWFYTKPPVRIPETEC
jgi:hypothetical protein